MLAGSAVALSGCVVFMAPPSAKLKGKTVTITVKGCASQSSGSPSGSCTNTGNSMSDAATSSTTNPKDQQVFLGFLVAKGSKAPASFTATSGPNPGGGKLKFKLTSSYTAQLKKGAPPSGGKKWYGYTSQFFQYSSTSGQQNFIAKAAFGLAPGAKSFSYKAVIGGRIAFSTTTTLRCGKPLTSLSTQSGHEIIICVDDSASGSA